MLAERGEYDRMLEYLEVAVDGAKWFFGNPDNPAPLSALNAACKSLFFAVASSFNCLRYLPADHAQRKAVYAKTFQMATECVQACIRDATRAHGRPSEGIALYSEVMFFENWVPVDIEFDHEEFLLLLIELYDLYRPYLDQHQSPSTREVWFLRLGCVYNDMATIYNCTRSRILEGHISPASIDQGLFNSVVARLDDCRKTSNPSMYERNMI
jgi:hypothetical protein